MDFKCKTENVKEMSGLWGVWFWALGNPSVTFTWGYFAAWGTFPVIPFNPHRDASGWLLSALIFTGVGGCGTESLGPTENK